jgi:hypothetical protein
MSSQESQNNSILSKVNTLDKLEQFLKKKKKKYKRSFKL